MVNEDSIYVKNCQSLPYLETLSPFELPSTVSRMNGVYRAFSLRKIMLHYIFPDDIIIGRAIENYDSIVPHNIYIIVTNSEILLCYIDDISIETSLLNCRTDELVSPKFEMPLNDIQEIWLAVEKYSTKIQPVINVNQDLYNSFEDLTQRLEKEVEALKNLVKIAGKTST